MARRIGIWRLSAVWLVLFTGCATHADRLRDIRYQFYSGDLQAAGENIDKQLSRGGKDAGVLKLDRAIVHLASGRPQRAEQLLREVRDEFDHLEQKSLAESVLATLTDDQRRAYAGEDYEKVLLRAMLSLSNLMYDGRDAGAYALQIGEKQRQIVQAGADPDGNNPKLAYQRIALGAYVYGLLREETHANYDDVVRSYTKVVSWQPAFQAGHGDLERAQHGRHSSPGDGVLYVLTLVGRGPYKEETLDMPSSAALLIADRILSATAEYSLPPTIAPIKVPAVVLFNNRIENVLVSVDGRPVGGTETITDVGRLAVDQYQAVYPEVIARAVARRVVKKAIIYAGKDAMGIGNDSAANFLMDVGGVVWEATEAADTRCWGLLPDKIQVLRVELPVGEHRIALAAAAGASPLGPEQSRQVEVFDGRNTYLLAYLPETSVVGQILVGAQ